jgi:hypothetical protein
VVGECGTIPPNAKERYIPKNWRTATQQAPKGSPSKVMEATVVAVGTERSEALMSDSPKNGDRV